MADQTETETTEFDAEKAREFYGSATNDDLKAELASRELATSGNKPELVDRLVDHDRERHEAENATSADEAEQPAAPAAEGEQPAAAASPTANMTPEEMRAHIEYLEGALTEALQAKAATAGGDGEERVAPEDDSEICGLCYPQGWPDPQGARVAHIECEHGTYDR